MNLSDALALEYHAPNRCIHPKEASLRRVLSFASDEAPRASNRPYHVRRAATGAHARA